MTGEADKHPTDGAIRMVELGLFLAEEVKRLTGGRQASTFVLLDATPDVPLFAPVR